MRYIRGQECDIESFSFRSVPRQSLSLVVRHDKKYRTDLSEDVSESRADV